MCSLSFLFVPGKNPFIHLCHDHSCQFIHVIKPMTSGYWLGPVLDARQGPEPLQFQVYTRGPPAPVQPFFQIQDIFGFNLPYSPFLMY